MNPQTPPSTTPVPPMPKKESSMSGVAAIIIIVVLLAIGGIYYLLTGGGALAPQAENLPGLEEAQNSDDPAVQAALSQSSSDDLNSIEADVAATDFAEIEAALSELDAQ